MSASTLAQYSARARSRVGAAAPGIAEHSRQRLASLGEMVALLPEPEQRRAESKRPLRVARGDQVVDGGAEVVVLDVAAAQPRFALRPDSSPASLPRRAPACRRRARARSPPPRRARSSRSRPYSRNVSSMTKRGSPSSDTRCTSRLLSTSDATPSRRRRRGPRWCCRPPRRPRACSRRRTPTGGERASARPASAGRSST